MLQPDQANIMPLKDKMNNYNKAHTPVPPILKLNLDCWDEIFEYMTLEHLHILSETCKTLQEIVGFYFQNNFKSSKIWIKHDGFRLNSIKLNGFSRFIEKVWMDGGLDDFQFAGSHCDGTIKEIYFDIFSLSQPKIDCIKFLLAKVEIILLTDCIIPGDFYEMFLKFCPNIRRLSVLCYEGFQNQWLFQKYPQLEYLKLAGHVTFPFHDVKLFFENNSNVRSIAINGQYVFENRHLFIESQLKFHDLTVSLEPNQTADTNQILNLFQEFHKNGIFQRLHLFLNGKEWDELFFEQLPSVPALINLCLDYLSTDMNLRISAELKKFEVFRPLNVGVDVLETFAKGCVNLERIVFREAYSNEILPFICHSNRLKEIRVCWLKPGTLFNGFVLNLLKLNDEREKLNGARKLTIYVEERVFLATKWAANGKINYKSIEMRRMTSYQDPKYYATFV